VSFRPRSAAWTFALASAAAALAAVAFALAPGSSEAATAATCAPGHATKREASFTRRQRSLLAILRRDRCRPGHLSAATESFDPTPAPCAPSLFSPFTFDTNEGTNFSPLPLAATGPLRAVMLFVDFPDLSGTESTKRLYNSIVPRSRSWFAEASYGRASLEVTPVHRWFRMPHGFRGYGFGDGVSFDEQHHYIDSAVAAADATFDFSPYKIIYIVAPRGFNLERSPAFHAHEHGGIVVDGTELRYGSTFGEDIRSPDPDYPANVLIHETGHVLGLPDLYDTLNPVYPSLQRYAGGWDMMSSTGPGAHFLAWHKWKLGWLDQTQLTCLQGPGTLTTTLTPLARRGGLKAVVVPAGPSSTLVVEARRKLGHDARLCEQGILVYSVDATILSGHGPIRIHAAQRDRSGEGIDECGLLSQAPFDRASGEVARYVDSAAGVTVDVLAAGATGYRVRVTRT
jgi:M6 family metalloprotease-like protein